MDVRDEGREGGRRPRTRGGKAQHREEGASVKVSLILPRKAANVLGVESAMTRRTQSAIVTELIHANLKRFVIQDRGGPAQEVSADPADEVRDSVPIVPIPEALTSPGEDSPAELPEKGRGRGRRAG